MTNQPMSKSDKILNRTTIPSSSNRKVKSQSLDSMDIYLEAIENLKKEVTNLENNFDDKDIEHKIPVIVLETIPLGDLEILVENLQQKTEELVNFVNLEEKELNIVKDLEVKLSKQLAKANEIEASSIESQLVENQELIQLLEKTLIGQRRNLKKQQEILNQHLKILNRRKGIFDLKSFDTINLAPLLESTPAGNLIKKIKSKLNQVDLAKLENKTQQQKPSLNFWQPTETPLWDQKQPHKKEKQWPKWAIPTLMLAGLLVVAGSVVYTLNFTSQSSEKPSLEPVIKPLKREAVAAVGYIEPKGEAIKLSASAALEGVRVEQLLVQQGDWVKQGQIIAILDNQDRLQAALEQTQKQVKLAEAKLAQIKAGTKPGEVQAQDAEFQKIQAELTGQIASQKAIIKELQAQLEGERQSKMATITRIKAELRHAQGQCQRYENLFQTGAVSDQQRQEICLQQETNTEHLREAQAHLQQTVNTLNAKITEAKANLERITATLKQQVKAEGATLSALEEVRFVDVQVAEAELEGAKTAEKKAQAELRLAYVRAPRDGQILKIYTWPGEVINDEGIVDMGQTNQMYVRAEVYETDISRVRVGQKVIVKGDRIVEDLQGTVEEIGLQVSRKDIFDTDPVADADARVVEVKISLSPEASKQVAGLTNLQVRVIIDISSS